MGELSRVLSRDRFDRYVTRENRDRFLESLIREPDLIEGTTENFLLMPSPPKTA